MRVSDLVNALQRAALFGQQPQPLPPAKSPKKRKESPNPPDPTSDPTRTRTLTERGVGCGGEGHGATEAHDGGLERALKGLGHRTSCKRPRRQGVGGAPGPQRTGGSPPSGSRARGRQCYAGAEAAQQERNRGATEAQQRRSRGRAAVRLNAQMRARRRWCARAGGGAQAGRGRGWLGDDWTAIAWACALRCVCGGESERASDESE